MFENMLIKFMDFMAGVFYRHPWAIVPVMGLNWVVALSFAYTADHTTGVVKAVSAVVALTFLFLVTVLIGFANIGARYERKADNR